MIRKDSSMDFMMDVLIVGFGVYLIYCAVKMKRTGELTKGVIIRKDADLTKAPDVPGFIRYMYAKVIAIGICTCICGTLGIINDTYMQLGMMYLCCSDRNFCICHSESTKKISGNLTIPGYFFVCFCL